MADDQGGAATGAQLRLQGLDGEDVQVVGGLVQQQNIRSLGEGARQGGAAGLTARQAGGRPRRIQAKGFKSGFRLVDLGAAGCGVAQQAVAQNGRLLGQEHDPRRRTKETVPRIRLGQAGQYTHQGRFPGAIAAHQARADARLQGEVDPIEQLARTVGETHVLQGDHRRAGVHGGWS